MAPFRTISVWAAALLGPMLAGAIVAATLFMAVSLDPSQTITAGLDPWVDAARASAWFAGLLVASAIGLRLWHKQRLRVVGLLLITAALGVSLLLSARFLGDYF